MPGIETRPSCVALETKLSRTLNPVLKVELHAHSNLDPHDGIFHTTRQLIDRAAELGYHALSVTCHNRYFDPTYDVAYARDRGMVLLPGVERTIGRAHVLLINFPETCQQVNSFDAAVALKDAHPNGLVIAPHPFYIVENPLDFRA